MDPLTRALIAASYAGTITGVLTVLWFVRRELLLRPLAWASKCAESRPRLCLILVCLVAPAIRLAMLPWFEVPQPRVEDEFCHLLHADTFAGGRLTNPTHPFKRHFEAMYVLQEPSYACSYPPGLGAVMAAGQVVTGHPWFGIVLGTGLMCGAIFWMLSGWTSPFWALAGALIAAFRWGVASYWMNSYFGGSATAAAGALVLGALPRFIEQRHPRRYALLMGAGWAVVWFIRPYESVVFAAGVGFVLLLFTLWKRPPLESLMRNLIAPLALIGLLAGVFSAYHNWRVTGDALLLPVQLGRSLQGIPQSFFWQPEIPEPPLQEWAMRENYRWQLEARRSADTPSKLVRTQLVRTRSLWAFFVSLFYTGPFFIALLTARRDSRVRLLAALGAVGFIGTAVFPFYYAHYLAAYTAVVVFLIVTGLNRMSNWSWRGFPAGAIAAATLVIWASLRSSDPERWKEGDPVPRAGIISQLEKTPGKDLVFVRYGPQHDFHQEWIYNSADIDASPIAWAREIDPVSDSALLRYFAGRSVWVVYADEVPPRLEPYSAGK